MRDTRRGTTLIELLVVIGILVVLIALLLPGVMSSRESARRTSCINNQHNLALAINNFESIKKRYPGYRNLQAMTDDGIARSTSWVFPLLPYFEEEIIFHQHGERGPSTDRGMLPNQNLPILVCPSDAMASRTAYEQSVSFNSYSVNTGQIDVAPSMELPGDWRANGVFVNRFPYDMEGRPVRFESVSLKYLSQHDGLSRTLLLSENCDTGDWFDDTEALTGFVWEPSLMNGQAVPQITRRINDGIGLGTLTSVMPRSHETNVSTPDVILAQLSSPSGQLLACTGCQPRPPLIDPDPVINEDPVQPPTEPDSQRPTSDVGHLGEIGYARLSSMHTGGVIATFADGHVRFVREDMDYLIYALLMTPNGAASQISGTDTPSPNVFRETPLQSTDLD